MHELLRSQPSPREEEESVGAPGEGEGDSIRPEVGDLTGFNNIDFTEWPYR